jgi:hypothetical protein
MRRLTALISDRFVRAELPPPDPPSLSPITTMVRTRINRVLRRRLSDRVAEVFEEACVGGDLETAEELLEVLEAMHRRRQAAVGERRISTDELARAREQVAARKAEREQTLAEAG